MGASGYADVCIEAVPETAKNGDELPACPSLRRGEFSGGPPTATMPRLVSITSIPAQQQSCGLKVIILQDIFLHPSVWLGLDWGRAGVCGPNPVLPQASLPF